MGHALRLERIAEGPDDVFLPDEFVEATGTPAARDDLEAGFRHWRLGKDGPKGVSTGQTPVYSHSIVAGGLDETS